MSRRLLRTLAQRLGRILKLLIEGMISDQFLADLNAVIRQSCDFDAQQIHRERCVRRIQLTLSGVIRRLQLDGTLTTFGSFATGFSSGGSDIDVVLLSTLNPAMVLPALGEIANLLPTAGSGNDGRRRTSNI